MDGMACPPVVIVETMDMSGQWNNGCHLRTSYRHQFNTTPITEQESCIPCRRLSMPGGACMLEEGILGVMNDSSPFED